MQNDFIFPCANLEEVEGGGVSGLKKLKRNIKHTDSKITKSSNSSTPLLANKYVPQLTIIGQNCIEKNLSEV